jgi:hypothetical protein
MFKTCNGDLNSYKNTQKVEFKEIKRKLTKKIVDTEKNYVEKFSKVIYDG